MLRQLISIPAGLSGMNIRDFILYTLAGATIWNIILAVIGFYLYEIRDRIFPYIEIILWSLGGLLVVYLAYKAWKSSGKNRKKATEDQTG